MEARTKIEEIISEKKALKYIENAKILFCIIDSRKKIRYLNSESCKLLGYEKEELIGKEIVNIVDKEKKNNMDILLSGIINEDMIGIDGFEIEVVAKNGEKKIVECSVSLVYNEKLEVDELILSGSDKTTAKQLEAERENMLIETKDRAREMSCLYDISRYMQENKKFDSGTMDIIKSGFRNSDKLSILLVKGEERYESKNFKESQFKFRKELELNNNGLSYIEFYFESEKSYQKELVKSYERIEKFINVMIKAIEVIFRNKELEEKANEKMNELKLTQEIAKLGTVIYYLETGDVEASKEVYSIFGIDEKVYEKVEIFDYLIKELRKGERVDKKVIKYVNKEGKEMYLSIKGEKIYKANRIYKVIVSILEITDMKKKEMELEKAKTEAESANISKNMFLANMSHELRTPLNSILGFSQLLLRNKTIDSDGIDKVETIIKSGNHLLDIINTILDISKIEAGKIEVVNSRFGLKKFFNIIEKIFLYKSLEKKININFICNNCCDMEIISDEKKLKQIYINVIGNAVKFTEKGEVTITTSIKEEQGGRIKIETIVRDTGMGMPENFKNLIFKRFERAENNICRKDGSGLGLAISKELAMLIGGDIEIVESVLGEGSTFKIYFYAEKALKKESDSKVDKKIVKVNSKKLGIKALIADDSKESRKILSEILSLVGVKYEEAADGNECMRKCSENEYDVVFTDIVMPEKDGISVINELRKMEQYREKIIIAFTASVFKEQLETVFEAGADEVLIKPVNENSIFNLLEKYFGIICNNSVKLEENKKIKNSNKISLPENIVSAIRESLINGDIDEILRICSENEDKYEIIKEINRFAKEYEFEKIYEIIDNN